MYPFKRTYLKTFLFLIAFLSILTCIDSYGRIGSFLALSLNGFKNNFFWQPLTYIFLLPHPSVSVGFLLRLAVNLYIFFFCSSFIVKWKGNRHFLAFFFAITLFSAFLALALMPTFPESLLGLNILICAIATAWLMLSGDVKFHLLTFSFKAKWMVINLIMLRILYNLSLGLYLTAILDLAAVLFSYLYVLVIWQKTSPFPALLRFEKPLTEIFKKRK